MADFAREGPERGDLNWEAALGVHFFVAEGLTRGGMGTTGGSSWFLDELFVKGDLKGFFSF